MSDLADRERGANAAFNVSRPALSDRAEPVPNPTDAVVRVVAAGICGSALHPYASMPPKASAPPSSPHHHAPTSSASSR